jgi:hypothetical protein
LIHKEQQIPIYRAVSLPRLEDLRRDYLGESWSYEEWGAIDFGKANLQPPRYLIKAVTGADNIDWKESFKCHFQFGRFNEELELRVIDSSEGSIKISQIVPFKDLPK